MPTCQRQAGASSRGQPAQPDAILREKPGKLHTRLHYDVLKARSLAERGEGNFLGSAGANFKRPVLQTGRSTKNWQNADPVTVLVAATSAQKI